MMQSRVLLRCLRWLALGFWALFAACAWAQNAGEVLAVPALTARVMDGTGTLSAEQKTQINAKLAAFEKSQGSQIVVLLVPSTAPEDIASYANRVANAWKLGRKEVGDGVLMVVAIKDHKMRLEIAKTLEGAIPDLAAHRIMEETMKPAFRAGDYAGGINAAVDQLMGLIKGEALPAPVQKARGVGVGQGGKSSWGELFSNALIFGLLLVPMMAHGLRRSLGRAGGALALGGLAGVLAWWVSSLVLAGVGAALLIFFYAWFSAAILGAMGGGGGIGAGPIIWGGGAGRGWGDDGGGGDSFGAGGGGYFGGGGASDDW